MFSVNLPKKKIQTSRARSAARPTKRSRRRPYYKLLPVTIAGLIVALIILFIGLLIYTGIVFLTKIDIEYSTTVPLLILLGSVTIGSLVSSLIIRGKSPLPAGTLGLLFFLFCLYQSVQSASEGGVVSVKGTVLKLALILLAAFTGYIISWALAIPARRRERERRQEQNTRWAS